MKISHIYYEDRLVRSSIIFPDVYIGVKIAFVQYDSDYLIEKKTRKTDLFVNVFVLLNVYT